MILNLHEIGLWQGVYLNRFLIALGIEFLPFLSRSDKKREESFAIQLLKVYLNQLSDFLLEFRYLG